MSDKLLNCPFCGEDAGVYGARLSQETPMVCCRCCGAQMRGHNVVEKWNTRIVGWSPIETAPKDGTRIIVGGKSPNGIAAHDEVGQAYWREAMYGEHVRICDEPAGFYWVTDGNRSGQCSWYVNLWMDMPELPE